MMKPLTLALLLLPAGRVQADTAVTLENGSGRDLLVTRAADHGSTPMQVTTFCRLASHSHCLSEPRPFDRRVWQDPAHRPAGCPEFEYLLRSGDAATFWFESPGEVAVRGEIRDWPGDALAWFHGVLVYPFNASPFPLPEEPPRVPAAAIALIPG